MKNISLTLLFAFSSLLCSAQKEHLNQELLKISKVYSTAAANLENFETLLDLLGNITTQQVYPKLYYWQSDDKTPILKQGFLLANNESKWETQITIKVNSNLLVSCVANIPYNSNTIEIAILYKTYGELYESDYDIITKKKVDIENNIYTEMATLKNGKVVFQNKNWIRAFSVLGVDGSFVIEPNYFFSAKK